MHTSIDKKINSAAIKTAGLDFAKSVFVCKDIAEGRIPMTNKIVIKPNITCRTLGSAGYSKIGTMGIVTDAYFVEGIIGNMQKLGLPSNNFYIRETSCYNEFEESGYISMASRQEQILKTSMLM